MIIDFHAHILPGLDHGCKNVQTSLCQLRRAKHAGVDIIVATSHFYPHIDTVESYLGRRQEAWEKLQSVLSPNLPQVFLGAEVLVCEGIENMEGLMRLSVMDSGILLVEMPYTDWNDRMTNTVVSMNAQCGGKAILAHADRYSEGCVEDLFEQGLRGQINLNNLCKIRKRRHLLRWIKSGKIVALGSDIHGRSRIHRKLRKVKAILGNDFMEIMDHSEHFLLKQIAEDSH